MSLLDMIGPVMVGPSSSHTAGACRIGLVAREVLGHAPERALITLHGSFAKTGKGHGTDRAIVAGLLGMRPDDTRLPGALELAPQLGLDIEWRTADLGDVHPNTARIEVASRGNQMSVTASSIGGGAIEVHDVSGFRVFFTAAQSTLLVGHHDTYGAIANVTRVVAKDHVNIAALTCNRERRGGEALMCLELDHPLSNAAIREVANLPETTWVRMLAPLMDG